METFPLSLRLANVLNSAGIKIAGDLHGHTFTYFVRMRNCGKKTVDELADVVRSLQAGNTEAVPSGSTARDPNLLDVQSHLTDIPFAELPLSVRLSGALEHHGFEKLGDLHGVNTGELIKTRNCGRKCIVELRALLRRAEVGEFTTTPELDVAGALRTVVRAVDAGLERLGNRDLKIFEERLWGNSGEPRTLEDVGNQFGMTRERVRQIVKFAFQKILKGGGPVLARAIEVVACDCEKHVLPFTRALFEKQLGSETIEAKYSTGSYVHVLDYMSPSIPAWPMGSTREGCNEPLTVSILDALEHWMRESGSRPNAKEAFDCLRAQQTFRSLSCSAFLAALRVARKIVVDFPQPDEPRLRPRRLRLFDITWPVLSESSAPLTPEEIMERAIIRFGSDSVSLSTRTAENALSAYSGVFRLGPRAFGLRQHFASSKTEAANIQSAFEKLLQKENRPISSIEVVDRGTIPLPVGVNSYELAEIIREDARFIDLGRRLFALAVWGAQERKHIWDLLPRVIAEADRPMTTTEIYEGLTKLRSATLTGLSNQLSSHSEIQSLGFGYHGLVSWADSRKDFFVTKRRIVERAVRRADPPIRFDALCEVFGVPISGVLGDALWKTCAASEKLRRAPDRCGPDSFLLHKIVSLEQALVTVSRTLGRPAPAYELEWELRGRFGDLFVVQLRQIDDRLAKCPKFLQNADGNYFLDADLDFGEFDLDAIRTAAASALREAREILSCVELLERLELMGFDLEEMSEGMLASVLRSGEDFREVGNQRFRAK